MIEKCEYIFRVVCTDQPCLLIYCFRKGVIGFELLIKVCSIQV